MALVRIYKKEYAEETGQGHGGQEVKGKGIVTSAGGVDDSARDDGTDERGGGPEEVEEREEEEFLAARRHLRNLCSVSGGAQCDLFGAELMREILKETAHHDLRISIVGTNETPITLKCPELPWVMKPDLLRPDTYHPPHIEKNDTKNNPAVHGFGFEVILVLNGPVAID